MKLEVRPRVPRQQAAILRQALAVLCKVSPVIEEVRVVAIAACEMPDFEGGFCHGLFFSPDPRIQVPTILIAALRKDVQAILAHEWGHYEQYRDRERIQEKSDIAKREKRLLKAIKGTK